MGDGAAHRISRQRKPRVHITYDVHKGDVIKKTELPFVVGVMADLSGAPKQPLPALKDRKFTEIDRRNFDEVMKKSGARAAFKVPNKLSDDPDATMGVDLEFETMRDFEPDRVAEQVGELRELLDVRTRLKSLLAKTTTSDEYTQFLRDVIEKSDVRDAVAQELGIEDKTDGGD